MRERKADGVPNRENSRRDTKNRPEMPETASLEGLGTPYDCLPRRQDGRAADKGGGWTTLKKHTLPSSLQISAETIAGVETAALSAPTRALGQRRARLHQGRQRRGRLRSAIHRQPLQELENPKGRKPEKSQKERHTRVSCFVPFRAF